MKKTITALVLVVTMMILGTPYAFADVNAANEARLIRSQADALIAAVDEDLLMLDAVDNTIDQSVPVSVRESIIADADFSPMDGVSKDAIELEVNKTVKKIGEVIHADGTIANMYVAAAVASDVKEDMNFHDQHGIKAWAYVYWIDNLGTSNELYAAEAIWDPKGNAVENRQVRYGTSDPGWFSWLSGPTIKYPTTNDAYYKDSSYTGLTLRCQTKIDVVNVGTVTCNVGSRFVTR